MIHLVTGGSGSGKSEYAEALVQKLRGKSGQAEIRRMVLTYILQPCSHTQKKR